jgi:hypothetical protein
MPDLTRRTFLSRGSVSAVGAIGALSVGPAAIAAVVTGGSASTDIEDAGELAALEGPLFVHVRDAASGEVEVLMDEKSLVFNDTALVNKLLRAAQ